MYPVSQNSEKPTTTLHHLYATKFSSLTGLSNMNHDKIRSITNNLKRFVALEEFYSNPNKCLNYVFEFIMGNCNFLIKTKDSSSILINLFELLRELVTGMNTISIPPIGFERTEMHMIITMLTNVIDGKLNNHVKMEAGKIVSKLVEIIDACDLADLDDLSSKATWLFETEQSIIELCRLFCAYLKRKNEAQLDLKRIIIWVKECLVNHVTKESDPQVLLHILKCWVVYYETCESIGKDELINNLHGILSLLCTLMCNPLLRNYTEQLLTNIVYQQYYTDSLTNSRLKAEMFKVIQNLPDDFLQWPHTNGNIFLIIAYLQLQHSRLLWSPTDMLDSMVTYLEIQIFPQRPVLKALLMLYPVVIYSNPNVTINNKNEVLIRKLNKTLLDLLSMCRTLPEILTYHPTQMMWLLVNADTSLKNRLLIYWLDNCKNDDEILNTVERIKIGQFLVQFLVNFPDSTAACRLSSLIGRLTTEPALQEAVDAALPQLCSQPKVFLQVLQVKSAIPQNCSKIFSLIKVVSACLPFMMDDTDIQTSCWYTIRLLNTVLDQDGALKLFCEFDSCLRFLVAKTSCTSNDTAVAAISLLQKLVKYQISNGTRICYRVNVDFTKMLKGNQQRIIVGLHLLHTLLIYAHKPLLLTFSKETTVSLYHYVHTLIKQEEISSIALRVLKDLIIYENKLSFLLVTPYTLRIVCKMNLQQDSMRPFFDFLAIWLRHVSKVSYIDVPVTHIWNFVESVPNNEITCGNIIQLLNNYQRCHN